MACGKIRRKPVGISRRVFATSLGSIADLNAPNTPTVSRLHTPTNHVAPAIVVVITTVVVGIPVVIATVGVGIPVAAAIIVAKPMAATSTAGEPAAIGRGGPATSTGEASTTGSREAAAYMGRGPATSTGKAPSTAVIWWGNGSTIDVWTARTGSNKCANRIRCASDTRRNAAPSPSKLHGLPSSITSI